MSQYKTYSEIIKEEEKQQENRSNVVHINSAEERYKIVSSNNVVVIDYYTEWCGPCKECSPKYDELSLSISKDKCVLAKENVEKRLGGIPAQIHGVPCFHFYYQGHFLPNETLTGADMNKVKETIERLINQNSPNTNNNSNQEQNVPTMRANIRP